MKLLKAFAKFLENYTTYGQQTDGKINRVILRFTLNFYDYGYFTIFNSCLSFNLD